jgi:hypothetical protein
MKTINSTFIQFVAGVITLCSIAANASQATGDELKNATYVGIYELPVTLKGGRWEGKPFVPGGASRPSVGLVEDFHLSGDLNSDGTSEQVVVLWESSGGSGTRTYLAVMGKANGKLINITTALIGDRVKLREGRIKGGKVELDVTQAGPGEPACCPTQKATRSWSLDGKKLIEGQAIVSGQIKNKTD